ncbi:hypothetical protein CGCF415_v010017 [Colletotrichum fructicola]|nr:hypothetical protein CGCFRS4_v008797 [Colletotrichum fructicola]KAF4900634.1 hypothetical protein CGCF415_v010017 [Colletotrichum fructicola]KAF4931959.1 hypothetical protein CGCF245_v010939 [Colletotrichum fructicola]KAF5491374.1 hypothetical protein CGCF413_v011877 [Colletotrichum fructicola]
MLGSSRAVSHWRGFGVMLRVQSASLLASLSPPADPWSPGTLLGPRGLVPPTQTGLTLNRSSVHREPPFAIGAVHGQLSTLSFYTTAYKSYDVYPSRRRCLIRSLQAART